MFDRWGRTQLGRYRALGRSQTIIRSRLKSHISTHTVHKNLFGHSNNAGYPISNVLPTPTARIQSFEGYEHCVAHCVNSTAVRLENSNSPPHSASRARVDCLKHLNDCTVTRHYSLRKLLFFFKCDSSRIDQQFPRIRFLQSRHHMIAQNIHCTIIMNSFL